MICIAYNIYYEINKKPNITSRKLQSWKEQAQILRYKIASYFSKTNYKNNYILYNTMSETTNSSYLYYGNLLPGFKLQLLKPQLFENLTKGLTVKTFDSETQINNESVEITYYYMLFQENLVTVNERCCKNREYGFAEVTEGQDEFDIYVIENLHDVPNTKEKLYYSTKCINEFKKVVDSLINKDYYILIPAKYVQIAYS